MDLEKDLGIEILFCLSQAISLVIGLSKVFTLLFPNPEPQLTLTPILFTTGARGTGLGLADVHKIIKEHNGRVSLESEPHRGTKAIIMIPAADENRSRITDR